MPVRDDEIFAKKSLVANKNRYKDKCPCESQTLCFIVQYMYYLSPQRKGSTFCPIQTLPTTYTLLDNRLVMLLITSMQQ